MIKNIKSHKLLEYNNLWLFAVGMAGLLSLPFSLTYILPQLDTTIIASSLRAFIALSIELRSAFYSLCYSFSDRLIFDISLMFMNVRILMKEDSNQDLPCYTIPQISVCTFPCFVPHTSMPLPCRIYLLLLRFSFPGFCSFRKSFSVQPYCVAVYP